MDPVLVLLVVLTVAASGAAGWALCTATHRQRGLEVDPWSHLIPDSPSGLVPDPTGSPSGVL